MQTLILRVSAVTAFLPAQVGESEFNFGCKSIINIMKEKVHRPETFTEFVLMSNYPCACNEASFQCMHAHTHTHTHTLSLHYNKIRHNL